MNLARIGPSPILATMHKAAIVAFAMLALTSCATAFNGSATVINGPAGCRKKCEDWRLEFVGMVAMGEYSDGCICHVKGATAAAHDSTIASAAAVGVVLQMRAMQQQQQQAAAHR